MKRDVSLFHSNKNNLFFCNTSPPPVCAYKYDKQQTSSFGLTFELVSDLYGIVGSHHLQVHITICSIFQCAYDLTQSILNTS